MMNYTLSCLTIPIMQQECPHFHFFCHLTTPIMQIRKSHCLGERVEEYVEFFHSGGCSHEELNDTLRTSNIANPLDPMHQSKKINSK
jgi:hypothetical protein